MKSKMTGSALRESVSNPVDEKSYEDLQCDAIMSETSSRQVSC